MGGGGREGERGGGDGGRDGGREGWGGGDVPNPASSMYSAARRPGKQTRTSRLGQADSDKQA